MAKKQSKRILKIILIMASISSLFFVPWILLRIFLTPLPDSVQEQVDDAIGYKLDGIIVYVDQAGNPPEFYAAGWQNRKNKIPANSETLFRIASISKLYVAVAVAKLVNEKQLFLDKTLADYLPELEGRIENANKITLRMMVQHRSGIPNYTDYPGFWENDYSLSFEESLGLVLDTPAEFTPDKKYRYSNTNYLLIGKVLDKTLGYSHHQFIKKEILIPLGLNHTYSLLSEVNLDDVMSGYAVDYEPDLKPNDFVSPAGSMVATAQDVGIFLRALNDGSLLNENEQAIYSSIYTYEHTGLLPGYSSIAKYHKDIDAVVIQFVNTSGGYSWNVSEMVNKRIVKLVRQNSE